MSIWDSLIGGFQRRKVKLTDPGEWYVDRGNASGKSVTPSSALQLATAWSCIRLLSETIGTLPLGVFRKDAAGDRTSDPSHGLYDLLHDSPNADQTAAEFLEAMVACLCLWGNGYAIKEMSGSRLVALTFLQPDRMSVRRDQGRRIYRYSDPKGGWEKTEDEIFHLRGFGVGGDVGLSPIGYARQTMGAALAADEVAAGMFGSGLHLSGFIERADGGKAFTADQLNELADLWARFTGSRNAGRIMPLQPGMTFKALGMNPEDAQLLQTRSFHVEEICRWFRVPPFMIGHTEKSSSWGTGLEQQMIGFLTFSLRPYLTRIEQAVKKQLLSAGERKLVFAEFNLEGLMRADSTGRAALYNSASQNGWMRRSEIRSKENLPFVPGSDVLTVQSNLVPLDQLGSAAPDQQLRSAFLNWLRPEDGKDDAA